MICNMCGIKEAVVHVEKRQNGITEEFDVCEECLEKLKRTQEFTNDKETVDLIKAKFKDAIKSLVDISEFKDIDNATNVSCKRCGLTYDDFIKNKKVGCEECYKTFSKKLPFILKRVQGSKVYIGKQKANLAGSDMLNIEISRYRKLLKAAIKKEDYKEAARIRDIIRSVEKNNEKK